MKKVSLKLTKGQVKAIISVAVSAVVVCTLFVINLFFPLKYAGTYLVVRSSSPSDGMYIHILDVGQADCTIIEFPDGKNMLIDGGDGTYTCTYGIIKTLNGLGIDTIDYLVCTSVNSEHCGGLADIISVKDVSVIYYPYCKNIYFNDNYHDFYTAASESGAEMIISEYGVGAEGGEGETEYFFTFLSPSVHTNEQGEYYAMNTYATDENIDNASAILWLECGGKGVFYASDAQYSVLSQVVDSYSFYEDNGLGSYFSYGGHTVDFSDCVLYKVAGHGSDDCLCGGLTTLLSPDISVISYGGDNSEGCPSVDVLTNLYRYGVIFLTQYDEDITIKINSDGASRTDY
ncbi:MAG: MBL fold metallo-hydrolase [Clostridia bacterium]|nr:MBL fold metallo-hydrolase [Clostridia bacterium]